MFKTSFAYIHFLSPAGLRVSMIDREAVFTGTVANGMTVRLASELARALDGVANVVNDTSLAEDATAESELRALYTFAIGSDALLADEPLTLEVRGDRVKVHGEVGSEEARDWAQRFLPAIANGAKVEVALTVATRDGEAKPLPRVDGDSLQALVLTRLGLLGENAIARPRFKSRRQRVNCAAQVSDKALGELAEAIVAHTFGVREAKCQIEVPTA